MKRLESQGIPALLALFSTHYVDWTHKLLTADVVVRSFFFIRKIICVWSDVPRPKYTFDQELG